MGFPSGFRSCGDRPRSYCSSLVLVLVLPLFSFFFVGNCMQWMVCIVTVQRTAIVTELRILNHCSRFIGLYSAPPLYLNHGLTKFGSTQGKEPNSPPRYHTYILPPQFPQMTNKMVPELYVMRNQKSTPRVQKKCS